jgi:hypothetical protein
MALYLAGCCRSSRSSGPARSLHRQHDGNSTYFRRNFASSNFAAHHFGTGVLAKRKKKKTFFVHSRNKSFRVLQNLAKLAIVCLLFSKTNPRAYITDAIVNERESGPTEVAVLRPTRAVVLAREGLRLAAVVLARVLEVRCAVDALVPRLELEACAKESTARSA